MNPNHSIQALIPEQLDKASAFINRSALQHNANIARAITPNAKMLAVIKANAYGHGMLEVASTLDNSVDGFAVARIDEAIALRDKGFKKMIVVMSAAIDDPALLACKHHELTPVIHSRAGLELQTFADLDSYWLKIDSGMHRLGLCSDELNALDSNFDFKHCTSLMSHFSSGEAKDISTNDQQLKQFSQMIASHPQLNSVATISMANSASFLRHNNAKQYQSWRDKYLAARTHTEETIRPGIMLYGADPLEQANSSSESLLAAMTLAAPVLAVRKIKAGEYVGYNRRWQAPRDSMIATLGIGYADGYPRHATNGTAVIIKGQRASLVGTVSMDTIGVDITDLCKQGIDVKAGDTAQLWGETLSANEVAKNSGTIAYQLFTGVSERVKRIYL